MKHTYGSRLIVDDDPAKRSAAQELHARANALKITWQIYPSLADLRRAVDEAEKKYDAIPVLDIAAMIAMVDDDSDPRTPAQITHDLDDAETMATRKSDNPRW
jgi:hypothetical protein